MKIQDIFRLGKKGKTVSPKIINVDFVGKKDQPALLYIPYGMFMSFPENGLVGLLSDQGNEESLFALPTDLENREELEEGEIALGIPALKNRIYFKKDGSIVTQNEKGSITLDADGNIKQLSTTGKLGFKNDIDDLATVLTDLITEITAIITVGSPTTQALSPASIINFTAINARLATILEAQ